MNAPTCTKCLRPCFFDRKSMTYSPYCGNTCRLSIPAPRQQPRHQQPQPQQQYIPQPQQYVPQRAVQGNPICICCHNAAFFDTKKGKFSPGCTLTHSRQAIRMGYHMPR